MALFMNGSRKIIKKDDPIGNDQWAIDVIKDIGLYDQRIYKNGYHPKTCLILMININLHHNFLKVHRFIRTHGLFSVNEQIICGSLSIYFDILRIQYAFCRTKNVPWHILAERFLLYGKAISQLFLKE